MNHLKNCRRCGKVFTSCDGSVLCNCCSEEDDMVFKSIREYVFDHPGTTAYELASKFNFSISRITRYINEGKFKTARDN